MKTKETVQTNVGQVDVNLDEIFNGAPSGDTMTLPDDNAQKPNVFTKRPDVDLSFIDSNEDDDSEEDQDDDLGDAVSKAKPAANVDENDINQLLNLDGDEENDENEEEAQQQKRGRKKIDGINDVISKLIESDKLIPFDDDKPLEEYTAKDLEELIQANLDETARQVRMETPQKFFESLPEELQIAARYVADGGQDLKGLFGALAQVEETRQLSLDTERDQEYIIREYLTATGYGTAEDIEEEIEVWKDLGKLEAQASKFKPKLDKMQEQIIERKIQEQEMRKKQQEQASQSYMENVYNTLKDGALGETKLDKKTQSMLYNGLVQPAYPSISGKNTNLLGHLLEKYQFVEPRHDLIAEALWLLADPDGYKSKIMSKGEQQATADTVRKLKTAQAQKGSSAAAMDDEGDNSRRPNTNSNTRRIPRNNNFFKRL